MAHECPECGQQCHCNGDIDDCCNNFEYDVGRCNHCEGRNDSEDDEDAGRTELDSHHGERFNTGGIYGGTIY